MKTRFLPKLVNGQTGDPALFVDLIREKRALLLDCGQINDLSASEILRVSDVFVTHTHIDHFIGFEHLLRLHLGRGRRVRIFGPQGITACVKGKLSGYTWNLVRRQRLVFEVHEFDGQRSLVTEFPCRRKFKPRRARRPPASPWLWRDELIDVRCTVLDHKIPCLAFLVSERDFFNVDTVALAATGHQPGRWLNQLKAWAYAGRPAGGEVEIDGDRRPAADLADRLLIHTPGRRLAYVADAGAQNQDAIVELVRGADLLFCEGAFSHADRERAAETYHLTAWQAGQIAGRAGVRRLVIFHFSPKYEGRFGELEVEAQEAFERETGPVRPQEVDPAAPGDYSAGSKASGNS